MEKRCSPCGLKAPPNGGPVDRRGDPCRSDGSLAHSGLASQGFRLAACAVDLRFARSRVPFLAEGAVDALLMPATVSSTGQGARCRDPLPAAADVADSKSWALPGAGRSHERWILKNFGLRWSARTRQSGHRPRDVDGIRRPTRGRSSSKSAGAESLIACATRPASGRFECGSRPLTPDA